MRSMKGYVLHGKNDIRLETREIPILTEGSVLIRATRSGICGSDIHYFSDGYIGRFVPRAPFVLGHEVIGRVVEVAEGVDELSVGDRVVVEPCFPCGKCHACRTGRYNLCGDMRIIGSAGSFPHLDGGFAQFVTAPELNCFRVPESITDELGALVEPLAVGVHAAVRAGELAGRRILITGGGSIGQAVMAAVRAFGNSSRR